MATEWTTPITWVVSNKVTAAQMNAHIRDNSLYLYDAPRCALRLTATQSVANASTVAIAWDEAVWDSHGDMWDSGGPSAILCTRDGVLAFNLTAEWEDSANGGKRAAFLYKNGTLLRPFHSASADGVSPFSMSNTIETNCVDGDSFDVRVRQLSGAALNLVATRTVLTVRWVAAAPVSGE